MSIRGYTLVEMVVVIAIASIVIGCAVAATIFFYKNNSKALNQGYAVEGARRGIEEASGDIRGIQYGADGSYPVSSIGTSTFVFFSDTDSDGIAERVSYSLSGTTFKRGVTHSSGNPPSYNVANEATTTLTTLSRNILENISLFHFYNASSTEITVYSTTTAVASVSMTLIVNQDISTSTGDYTLRSTAALRNVSQF